MRADWILTGGPVITCDREGTIHQAVAMAGNRIAAAGTIAEMMELRGAGTEIIDLRGRAVVPGIIDSHCHVIGHGMNRRGVELKYPKTSSIEGIKDRIRQAAGSVPSTTWIRGWGYDHSKLTEGRHPTRWDLDEAVPAHPVVLTRTCGHIVVLNSRALEIAGVADNVSDPPGGRFQRIDGQLSGVVFGTAMAHLRDVWAPDLDEVRQALSLTAEDLLSHGITTVHDAGSPMSLATVLSEGQRRGDLPVRVNMMVVARNTDPEGQARVFARSGLTTGFGGDWARIGPYKIVVDGSSSGPTAATRQPYTSDPGDSGILYVQPEQLDELVEEGHAAGYQVTVHAVGDRAIEMFLDAVEKAREKHPRTDCRHRIEHCGICMPDLMDRIHALDIIPIPQPVFFHEFGDGYLRNYGPERVRHMFPARSFLERGIPAAASSDFPVTTMNPLLGISLAMTRVTQGGQSCFEEETVDLMSALRMYTCNGAYASFEEDSKGSIEPGKLADLAVLSGDILSTPPVDIRDMAVDMTFAGGRLVYERDQG